MSSRDIDFLRARFLSIAVLTFIVSTLKAETILVEDFESMDPGECWERLSNDPLRADFETRREFVHSGKVSYRLTTPAHEGHRPTG